MANQILGEGLRGACIIRIISTISQYLISSGPARRRLRAPGRQGPKNGHFTIGLPKELATFGPLPGPRKSGLGALFGAWTRGSRSHARIIRSIRIIRFIKIIELMRIIRNISSISQNLIFLSSARRLLRPLGPVVVLLGGGENRCTDHLLQFGL